MKKFLRRAVEGIRKWALKKLVGDCRIITDVYEGYVLETFENSNTEAVVWDFSLFDSMGIIGKKIYGDFSEENIRRIMKENGQETEEVLNRIKQIMSKPMIYYGIVARYNDGSHEILQQDLVDYYRGKEEEEGE